MSEDRSHAAEQRRGAEAWILGVIALLIVFVLLVVAYLIGYGQGEESASVAGPGATAAEAAQGAADAGAVAGEQGTTAPERGEGEDAATGDSDAGRGAAAGDKGEGGGAAAGEQGEGGAGGEARGRELFAGTCGGCHSLADSGSRADVGPDLDFLRPTREQVLAAIERGGSATGQMPAGLLKGADAEAVAAYVAGAAGR